MVTPENIQQWLASGITDAQVEVEGDGRHFFATIISDAFEGKSRIQRHQLVYGVLGEKMKEDIHALSMKTLTPSEA